MDAGSRCESLWQKVRTSSSSSSIVCSVSVVIPAAQHRRAQETGEHALALDSMRPAAAEQQNNRCALWRRWC
jgi:hypothetical protein